jgi:hypothetical protein
MRVLKIQPYLSDIELKEKMHSQKAAKDFQSVTFTHFYVRGKKIHIDIVIWIFCVPLQLRIYVISSNILNHG